MAQGVLSPQRLHSFLIRLRNHLQWLSYPMGKQIAIRDCSWHDRAQYIAFSTATRELIPLCRILQELLVSSPFASKDNTYILPPSKIYEDNASCIIVAHRDSQHRPQTKSISLKYHHLRDHINNGTIAIEKVASSSSNWADIFTKPLTAFAHKKL
jgi:hypothetical protein